MKRNIKIIEILTVVLIKPTKFILRSNLKNMHMYIHISENLNGLQYLEYARANYVARIR